LKDGYVTNEKNGKVLDVAGHRDRQHNNIGAYRKHGGLNQQFELIYVDEFPEPPRDGEMAEDWGFRIGVPFHVKSELGSGKHLDIIGRRMVIKTPAETRKTQSWYFDYRTRTIKNYYQKGWSFDIVNSGRTNRFQAYNTNSGWW